MHYAGRRFEDTMADADKERGRRIRERRDRMALTQEDVARMMDPPVSAKTVWNWEAGRGIRFDKLRELAELFGVAVEDLQGNAETPNPFKLAEYIDRQLAWFRETGERVEAQLTRMEERIARVEILVDALPTIERAIAAAERLEKALPRERIEGVVQRSATDRRGQAG